MANVLLPSNSDVSRETSEKNPHQKKFDPNCLQSRYIRLVTYLSEEQLVKVLEFKRSSIEHWTYALHDKDPDEKGGVKAPHTHVILKLYTSRSVGSVRNWFKALDDKGLPISTLGKACENIDEDTEYLTHKCFPGEVGTINRAFNKYIYPESIRNSDDPIYWEGLMTAGRNDKHDISEAVLALNNGEKNLHECVKEYGRDFIIHYNSIKTLLKDLDAETASGETITVICDKYENAYDDDLIKFQGRFYSKKSIAIRRGEIK